MLTKFNLVIALFMVAACAPFAIAQKMTAEDVIAKHLDSIGSADKRAAVKTLITTGEVRVEFITQKNQPASGRIVIASEGDKLFYGMSLNAADYPQEKVLYNGKKLDVSAARSGQRTLLGNFIQSNGAMVSQGLLGGVLSTAWPLLQSPTERKSKISFAGNKKIDGKDVYALSYSPKGGSDLEITLFFDQETFRHVRTEYKRTSSSGIGRTIDDSARQSESRIKLVEDFSDFKDVQGFMLPNKYKLYYSFSGASTTEISWTANLSDFAVNQALDAGTFEVPK